jgi:hypothetical protein
MVITRVKMSFPLQTRVDRASLYFDSFIYSMMIFQRTLNASVSHLESMRDCPQIFGNFMRFDSKIIHNVIFCKVPAFLNY